MKLLKRFCIAIVLIVLQGAHVYAQFNPANNTDIAMGVTSAARQTGNDFIMDASDEIDVSVWDLTNGGAAFGYRVNQSSPATISLTSSSGMDPDVALIKDGNGGIHALVVYYDGVGSDYLLDVFDFSGTFTLAASYNIRANVNFGTAVNIDADDSQNFMVIWDDFSTGDLRAIAGGYSGTTLSYGLMATVGTSSSNVGSYPDLCLFGNGTDRVTYCYLSGGVLYVDTDDLPTIVGGGTAASNVTTSSPAGGYVYQWPRIACPLSSGGTIDDWTVVFEEVDAPTDYFICGITYNGGVNAKVVYNDTGTPNCPGDIFNDLNFMPVVTYDNRNPSNIYVGWMYDGTSDPNVSNYATLPIVLQCDDFGDIRTAVSYLEVPTSLGTGDDDIGLSLSGKNGSDLIFITWVKTVQSDVYVKTISGIYGAGDLRLSNNIFTDDKFVFADAKTVEFYDLQGRLLNSSNNSYDEFLQNHTGLFLLKIIYNNGQSQTYKIPGKKL